MLTLRQYLKNFWGSHPKLQQYNNTYLYLAFFTAIIFIFFRLFEQPLIDLLIHHTQLYKENMQYLEQLRTSLEEEFVLLSGVHALLSTVESSSVGISVIVDAKIQIGNELKSLTSLAEDSQQYLKVSSYLTELFILLTYLGHYLTPVLFEINLIVLFLFCLAKCMQRFNIPHMLFKILKAGVLLLCLLQLALPYSIHFTALATQYVESHYDDSLNSYAKRIHDEYVGQQKDNSNDARAKSLINQNERLRVDKRHKVSSFFRFINQKLLRTTLMISITPIVIFLTMIITLRFFVESTMQLPEEMAVKSKKDRPVL